MNRRSFLKSLAVAPAAVLVRPPRAEAALPKAKITRVRIYKPPVLNNIFNQSNMIVTVETDAGITGIGEGGAKDTLEQCAGALIGKNPFKIEALWQEMYIAFFYPPGREKIHALGALVRADLAGGDIDDGRGHVRNLGGERGARGRLLTAGGSQAGGRAHTGGRGEERRAVEEAHGQTHAQWDKQEGRQWRSWFPGERAPGSGRGGHLV